MTTFQSPGEIIFSIGSYDVHWYGVIIAFSFLVGLKISLNMAGYYAKNDDHYTDHVINLATLLLMGGILCARLYYVIFNWDYFSINTDEILMTWKGGLSIHGAILGGMAIIFFYTYSNSLSFFRYTDIFAYGIAIAQSIGRWGNFFNSEVFGPPTNLPWKIYISPEYRPLEYVHSTYFHPTFLYESILNLMIFFILTYSIGRRFGKHYGVVTFSYLILYSLTRIVLEGFRTDNIFSIMGLHLPAFTSILLLIAGVIGLIFISYLDNFKFKLKTNALRQSRKNSKNKRYYSKKLRDMIKKL